jgi:hypothetical protein
MSTACIENMKTKIKNFWEKYETKIMLVLAFFLVAGLSFEAGVLKGADFSQKPLIIESASSADNCAPKEQNGSLEAARDPKTAQIESKTQEGSAPQDCAFVGSKNSDKYHLPNCRYAKGIKPENRVCFSSQDDAKSKGYLPDKNCIK